MTMINLNDPTADTAQHLTDEELAALLARKASLDDGEAVFVTTDDADEASEEPTIH